MTISVVGIGTWLPDKIRTNDAWPEDFQARALAHGDRTFNDIPAAVDPIAHAIVERDLALEAKDPFLGASRRHVADESITATEAEAEAALSALRDARIAPEDVDVIVSNSAVPDRLMPSTAAGVGQRIGAVKANAFGVDAACASAVVQLDLARAYVASGLARVVVLVQSHLLLRAMPLEHPAVPGLGDGATALVVARGRGLEIRATLGHTLGEFARAVTWVRGSDDETDRPWWKAGGDFRLGSRAPEIAKMLMRDTVTYGAKTLHETASRAGIELGRVRVLASVQPRGFMPGAIAERAGLARERAVVTYSRIAHVGACGPVFNLAEARAQGAIETGSWVALYGQGAGFTRSAAVLQATA